jgi:hypothetical protein
MLLTAYGAASGMVMKNGISTAGTAVEYYARGAGGGSRKVGPSAGTEAQNIVICATRPAHTIGYLGGFKPWLWAGAWQCRCR